MRQSPEQRRLWSLDEYIVVADLYLRRRRSSGEGDPDVVRLAQLTNRTPASISYRIGNLHGTANPGVGLKPVTGEALAIFTAMASSDTERERLTCEATRRLKSHLPAEPIQLPASAARLIEPEQMHAAESEMTVIARAQTVVRVEAQLVQRYLGWADPNRTQIKSLLIPTPASTLRVDLYDPVRHLLIEAKAAATREYVRYAIGQLLDYRRFLDPRPKCIALLLPSRPVAELMDLLRELDIGVIWDAGHGRFFEQLAHEAPAHRLPRA